MRCALLLSLIAAARAFAPPSILRASVVVKNEADAASTVPESYEKISIARRAVMPRALRRASTLSLPTKRLASGAQIACNSCLWHPPPEEMRPQKHTNTNATLRRCRTIDPLPTPHPRPTPRPPRRTTQAASDTTTPTP